MSSAAGPTSIDSWYLFRDVKSPMQRGDTIPMVTVEVKSCRRAGVVIVIHKNPQRGHVDVHRIRRVAYEARDLRREVARLKRLNDNFNARPERDASAYETTISELREDLDAARHKCIILDSRFETALRSAHEHQEAQERAMAMLAAVEREKMEITSGRDGTPQGLDGTIEGTEGRFKSDLAAALSQIDEERKATTRVELLLQESIGRMTTKHDRLTEFKGKAQEDMRIWAENSLARVQADYNAMQDTFGLLRQDVATKDEQLHIAEASLTASLPNTTIELAQLRRAEDEAPQWRVQLETRTSERDVLDFYLTRLMVEVKDKSQELARMSEIMKGSDERVEEFVQSVAGQVSVAMGNQGEQQAHSPSSSDRVDIGPSVATGGAVSGFVDHEPIIENAQTAGGNDVQTPLDNEGNRYQPADVPIWIPLSLTRKFRDIDDPDPFYWRFIILTPWHSPFTTAREPGKVKCLPKLSMYGVLVEDALQELRHSLESGDVKLNDTYPEYCVKYDYFYIPCSVQFGKILPGRTIRTQVAEMALRSDLPADALNWVPAGKDSDSGIWQRIIRIDEVGPNVGGLTSLRYTRAYRLQPRPRYVCGETQQFMTCDPRAGVHGMYGGGNRQHLSAKKVLSGTPRTGAVRTHNAVTLLFTGHTQEDVPVEYALQVLRRSLESGDVKLNDACPEYCVKFEYLQVPIRVQFGKILPGKVILCQQVAKSHRLSGHLPANAMNWIPTGKEQDSETCRGIICIENVEPPPAEHTNNRRRVGGA
ncbi:hypothetical protein PENSPDRAFT_736467 [Peniophora sp. CONT]|nr:hypothetical protein PENSPDRAFT_736467 [Peniophora sp. CONT]